MRAMILAAGRGERMRPLTDIRPKPLLEAGGKALIEWQIERLVQAGFKQIIINVHWLGAQIEARLGDGRRFGCMIRYSREHEPQETLGAIVMAGSLLGAEPFAVVSADIYTDYDYTKLLPHMLNIASGYPQHLAHLVLTGNPAYHPNGDMALVNGHISPNGEKLTYANIGVFHPRLFDGLRRGEAAKLFPWLYRFATNQRISGEFFDGTWENIGTPRELTDLNQRLNQKRTGTHG